MVHRLSDEDIESQVSQIMKRMGVSEPSLFDYPDKIHNAIQTEMLMRIVDKLDDGKQNFSIKKKNENG